MATAPAVEQRTNRRLVELVAIEGVTDISGKYLVRSGDRKEAIKPERVFGAAHLHQSEQFISGEVDAVAPSQANAYILAPDWRMWQPIGFKSYSVRFCQISESDAAKLLPKNVRYAERPVSSNDLRDLDAAA